MNAKLKEAREIVSVECHHQFDEAKGFLEGWEARGGEVEELVEALEKLHGECGDSCEGKKALSKYREASK